MLAGDRYRFGGTLAVGATSAIYHARFVPYGIDVALKVMHRELARDPIAVGRFLREWSCLARLHDPRAVVAYDHGELDGAPYLALELLHGERADVRVRARGAMPWRDALAVLRDVAAVLAEAHDHGIIHRDVATANLWLATDGAARLLDFGHAKLLPGGLGEELACGRAPVRPPYSAPELVLDRPCDGRADVYGLGIVALELLLGSVPNHGAIAVYPHDVPRSVERLVARCLAPDPRDRPAADVLGKEIVGALQRFAAVYPAVSIHDRAMR